MRWFVVMLLVANLALFFWLKHDALRDAPVAALPPPDIGRLQLSGINGSEEKPLGSDRPAIIDSPPRSASGADTPDHPPRMDLAGPVVASAPEPEGPAATGSLRHSASNGDLPSGLTDVASARRVDTPADASVADGPALPAAEPSEVSTVASAADAGTARAAAVADVASPDEPSLDDERRAEESDRLAGSVEAGTLGAAPSGPTAAPNEAAPASPTAGPTCARVGPLSAEAADQLIARLPVFVRLLSEATEEVDEVDDYFVMIPPLPSRAAGLETLAALEAAGITDTWLFRRGPRRNAISLGMFSRRAIAERHLRDVTEKGFEARLIERTKRREVRQLLVKNVDGGDVGLSLPLPKGVTADPQPCP